MIISDQNKSKVVKLLVRKIQKKHESISVMLSRKVKIESCFKIE